MCRVVHAEKLNINTILRIFNFAMQNCLDTRAMRRKENLLTNLVQPVVRYFWHNLRS